MKEHCRAQGQPGQTTWWSPDCVHLQVLSWGQPQALSRDLGNTDIVGWAGDGDGALSFSGRDFYFL